MEMQQVVVLTEKGVLQLTSLSRHVLYHATLSLLPQHSMHTVLPRSGSRKVEDFCSELPRAIQAKERVKKTSIAGLTDQFIPSIEIHKFLERATSVADFTLILERELLDLSRGEVDPDKLHEICWGIYEGERQGDISIPQWFSSTCTYRLWMIFCCVQEQGLGDQLSAVTTNEVIKRLVELCGYTWNEAYRYDEADSVDFPQYLRAIASYFTKLRLDMSLTCEVIADMVDEIVHGVLKKGYLTKKGHKRKNMRKRWFVLQRNLMKYFDTRESMSLKGQLVLNSNTEVKGIADKGKKRYMFEVTCGHTGKNFEIFADDQRSKHEWMLAIKKAIALARVMDGSLKQDDYTEYLTGFYLLKYGTPQPALSRQDSTVRGMKYHATLKEQRKRLSGKSKRGSKSSSPIKARENSAGEDLDPSSPRDEYMQMSRQDGDNVSSCSSSSSSGEGYVSMSPIRELKFSGRSHSMDLLDKSDMTDDMVCGISKSCTMSQATKSLHLLKNKGTPQSCPDKEDTDLPSPDLDVYEDTIIGTPIYTVGEQDSQLGGYIDVKKAGGQDKKPTRPSISDRNKEVELMAARSVNLNILGEEGEGEGEDHTPNKYLTIVRESLPGDSSPTPPVHPRRGNHTPENSQIEHTENKKLHRGDSAPLEHSPPRLTAHRGSEPLVERPQQRSTPSHSTAGNYINTKPKRTTPPPLPPR